MAQKDIVAIVLAAGKGTRMQSRLPKVMHSLLGKPMLCWCLDNLKGFKKVYAVIGPGQSVVSAFLKTHYKNVRPVYQKKQLGSGDALRCTQGALKSFNGNMLVLYADNPLFEISTIKKLIQRHILSSAACTLATAVLENPKGYGRIIRDDKNCISRIVEENDCLSYQSEIKEINSGLFCFKKDKLFKALKNLMPDNKKKEFYLTDVVKILADSGESLESITLTDTDQIQGINTVQDLAKANEIMRKRLLLKFIRQGITIIDPASTFISPDAKVGQGTVINPFCVIEGDVRIGKKCVVGPFCHLRGGTVIADEATVGNFTEVVRSQIGKRTLMKHFSYIGDCRVGVNANIGAGTVVANFNGRKKNKTYIGDRAFVGSDTVLVAPVKLGEGAATGAGSVVLAGKNIPKNKTAVGVPARVIGGLR